ncbi:non-receptor serine/threonine protein kinase [Lithospermum erythrorhizon]|uniref:mitogen-activated protein kinase kinase kinase n=1 Tax=Lithospermum erythrorhizon TaxID=34254 RepID=A0AAV3PD68_LITER
MPIWWKSSSKEAKKKTTKESFIDALQRRFKSSESKSTSPSGGSRRRGHDIVSEKGFNSQAHSRSPSPSKNVARCQSFNEMPQAQPLPLPNLHLAGIGQTDLDSRANSQLEKGYKLQSHLPLPRPGRNPQRQERAGIDVESAIASVSSDCSTETDDPIDSQQLSPLASDCELGPRTAAGSPSSTMSKDLSPAARQISRESSTVVNLSNNNRASSPKRRPLASHVPNLQVPRHGAFMSAPDSSMSSPSRSPLRAFGGEQLMIGKPYTDFPILGSGHCSSPGSGQNSGHNSMGGDTYGQLFWQPSRGSPEYSPIPSPRMTSPGPGSRIHSGAVTPLHPRAGGGAQESLAGRPDEGKQQSHRLPLPPVSISNSSPFSHSNSATTSPSFQRSPGRVENILSPGSRWKKGKLLGSGTFGHVYVGFNSESGEMCAMKEVTLFADDSKSKESAKQLAQEIAMLSRLRHPNIVQYYGSEMVSDRLYIYLEYVSGGSIYKLLKEYGELGETAIRSYTRQILSGLAYLHDKNTVHRDIKGANILVDPNGRVKLADFGMAKHLTGQAGPLSFKGSPYWMAPEVIKNTSGCNLAVDIWSLGCTVLEMATSKPPWSQYEGVAAIFKIGNGKELPEIPKHLSDDGKDFIRQCLQRNPFQRPSAANLLQHPFVSNAATVEKPITSSASTEAPSAITNGGISLGFGQARNIPGAELERLAIHSSRVSKSNFPSSDVLISRDNISCPVSPIGSPLLQPRRSPQHLSGRMSPSPISSPRTTSGSSTPLTGGAGTVPFHYINQSAYLQEGFGNLPKPTNSLPSNGPQYWDLDGSRRVQTGSQAFQELASSEHDSLARQVQRPDYREYYDGQSVLADRVSQQLLRDHGKLNPSVDLYPSPLASRTNGA